MKTTQNEAPANWSLPARLAVFSSLAVAGAVADLYSKHLVFAWLGLPEAGVDKTHWLWTGYVGIQTAVNQGAVFGLGQGGSQAFAALSIVAAIGIIYWLFIRGAARDRFLTFALGAVTGGIIGNLHDRLGLWHGADIAPQFRHGVRDWILFRYGEHSWPNFNIADTLLVCGAIMLVAHAFWPRAAEQADGQSAEKPAGVSELKREKATKSVENPAETTASASPS